MNIPDLKSKKLIWDCWADNAKNYPEKDAIVVCHAGEEPYRWTFGSILKQSDSFAAGLKKIGIKEGEVCAIIIRHNKYFYPLYMAVSRIGAIPAVLAYPNPRLHPEKFRQGIEGMSQRSGLDWIFTEESLDPMIRPLVEKEGSTIKGIHFPLTWDMEAELDDTMIEEMKDLCIRRKPDDPFLLQHSSGTTGLQKPVLLSHKAVIEHTANYAKAIDLTLEDKVASWLPLYHDMGLIAAFHLPLVFGITSIQVDTFEWVLAPVLLLEAVTKEKATVSWLPNFSYNILADKVFDDELEEVNLESWRMIINCSEPVRDESFSKFYNRFKNFGLRERALASCYAMAETTYAVTQTPPDTYPVTILADRIELANGKVKVVDDPEIARVCVSSGKLIEGCGIRIVDEAGNDLPEECVGEIAISSVSMFNGYRNYPEKTADVLKGEWYYSGDYGFKLGDEYFVIGRKKDIIIVAGNNIYPEDVEDAVSKIEGVIPGRVIAFGEYDTELGSEQISVACETNTADEKEQKKLQYAIMKGGMAMDVTIKKVYLVPPRWLIKSSAGKPSRKANKERLFNNEPLTWSK